MTKIPHITLTKLAREGPSLHFLGAGDTRVPPDFTAFSLQGGQGGEALLRAEA